MSCKPVFYLLAPVLLLSSCDKPTAADPARPGAPHPAGPYYDVRGLLDAQVRQLVARHAGVQKQVSLRGSASETAQVPQVKWADELQIFYQADINKAALRGAYQVDSASLPDGAVRHTYTLKPGHDNAPVAQLAVVQDKATNSLQLAATLRQDNVLFTSQKQLQLTLRQNQLQAYSVSGRQKLVLFDTLRYQAKVKVR